MLGFQWWLFEDWPGVHNGLVDYGTLEPKGNALSAQQIGKFVAPVVVLLGTVPSIIERRPALFFLGHISPIFAPFFAVFSRFSPS